MFKRSTPGGTVGRPAKPSETPNRRATPVTQPKSGTRVVGSKPSKTGK